MLHTLDIWILDMLTCSRLAYDVDSCRACWANTAYTQFNCKQLGANDVAGVLCIPLCCVNSDGWWLYTASLADGGYTNDISI